MLHIAIIRAKPIRNRENAQESIVRAQYTGRAVQSENHSVRPSHPSSILVSQLYIIIYELDIVIH